VSRQPEGLLKDRVLADLRQLPKTYARKIQQVSRRGIPDILACVNGNFVALELKRDAKLKPDALQEYERSRCWCARQQSSKLGHSHREDAAGVNLAPLGDRALIMPREGI
jgi:hypothetical protein